MRYIAAYLTEIWLKHFGTIEEIGELAKHGVYEKVPITECWNKTGAAPIGTRWVEVNKGDGKNIEYRSRLVAQEIRRDKYRSPNMDHSVTRMSAQCVIPARTMSSSIKMIF